VDLGQLRRRIHTGLLGEHLAGAPERRQRVRLPSGPVQSTHQLPPQPLVSWMLAGQPVQLGGQLPAHPGRQAHVHPVDDRGEAYLLQPRRLRAQDGGVEELGVCIAAP
jgi:hypothetical protein